MAEYYKILKNGKAIASYKRKKVALDRFEVSWLFCNPENDILQLIAPNGEVIAEY